MINLQSHNRKEIWESCISKNFCDNKLVGCAISYSDPHESFEIIQGKVSLEKEKEISEHSKFEIGSLTKIFTGLICAELILLKKFSLNTTIGELLSHTSGLPRLPGNISPKDRLDPYSDYKEGQLQDYLKEVKINSKDYCYSNLGYALLGRIIELTSDKKFEDVLSNLLLRLGMNNTQILNNESIEELCSPYDFELSKVKHWHMGIFSSAGSLVSLFDIIPPFLINKKRR